jgi:hypothetical protein
MEGPEPGAPVVELPQRVDRRVRLGPFPSARDALKFVCYAAAGAVLGPLASPYAWIPVLAGGFAISVWRPDGEAVDERAARWLRFQLRHSEGSNLNSRRVLTPVRGSVSHLANGRSVAIVRTGGVPLAYRPPADLATVFDRFRGLLRVSEGSLVVRSTTVPLRGAVVLPRGEGASEAERTACTGYRELVEVLCRRRRSRRVDISVTASVSGSDPERRLLERAQGLVDELSALGLQPTILRDHALAESVRGFGWTLSGGAP